jgi:capsular polysaccharide biosynthesis protein
VLLMIQDVPAGNGVNRREVNSEGLEGLVDSMSRFPEMNINTYVGQMKSRNMMERVAKKLKLESLGYIIDDMPDTIEVLPVAESNLIQVNVTDQNPEMAAKIANTLANEFISFISETNDYRLKKLEGFLTEKSVSNSKELSKVVARQAYLQTYPGTVSLSQLEYMNYRIAQIDGVNKLLQKKLAEIQTARSITLGELKLAVVSPAGILLKPTSPKKALNMAVAFAAGVIVSIVLVFLLNHLDQVVVESEEIEAVLGLTVLGEVSAGSSNESEKRDRHG